MPVHCEAAIFTDVHIGAATFQEEAFCDTLSSLRMGKEGVAIFGGDLIDRHEHAHGALGVAARRIRDLSWRKIYVTGNHDPVIERPTPDSAEWDVAVAPLRPFAASLGAELCYEYEFLWQEERCLVVHGHQFDSVLERPLMVKGLSAFYEMCQPVAKRFPELKKMVKGVAYRGSKHFKQIRDGAHALASERAVRYLVFGHDHRLLEHDCGSYTLFNPSCWKDDDPAVLIFGDQPELKMV